VALANLGVNADEVLTFLQAREIARGDFPLFFWTQPYQFPFEAYFLSYFVDWLPWDAFGVRVLQLSICLFAVVGFVLLALRLGSLRTTWPALLLVLFPSVYWLSRQVVLMTPQHAMTVTFAWMLPLILVVSRSSAQPQRWACAGGIAAGLAISNHLLSISLVAMVALALCLGRNMREGLRNTLWFLPGFCFGAAPYLYAKFFIPGAYEKVADTLPLSLAWTRIWDPVINRFVPLVLGIIPTYIPDTKDQIETFRALVAPTAWCFLLLVVALTAVRIHAFVRRLKIQRWPSVEPNDVFIGTTMLSLMLLCITGMDLRTRYALPIIWCFPFLVSYAYALLPKLGRIAIGFCTLGLVAVNIIGTHSLVAVWRQPGFSEKHAVLPNLAPLYNYFEQHGITRCYSAWWLSYRIIFDSKEQIICSPPFNDRFRGWPQPYYKQIVDRAENVAYVENTKYTHRLLRRHIFQEYLHYHRITYDRLGLGNFVTYRNFRHRDIEGQSIAIPQERIQVFASHGQETAPLLTDDSLATNWSSVVDQASGMSLTLRLDAVQPIHALQLFSLDLRHETEPPRVRIEALTADGSWKPLIRNSLGQPHLIRLATNVRPEPFDGLELTFGFEPVFTQELRVRIIKPSQKLPWRLAELRVLTEG
jgi:hypothetical protein